MFHLDTPLSQGTQPTPTFTTARLDLFPAHATYAPPTGEPPLPTPTVLNVRVIFTLDTAYVFRDARQSGYPELIFERRFADAYITGQTYIAEFDDGAVLSCTRSGGCGCGSRLRGFRPWSGGLSQAASLEKRPPP